MAHLVDTNIFLEILLGDSKADVCSSFISRHRGDLYITDFSINSIGVVTNRLKKIEQFEIFLRDILPHVHIARLPEFSYEALVESIKEKKIKGLRGLPEEIENGDGERAQERNLKVNICGNCLGDSSLRPNCHRQFGLRSE